MFQTLRNLYNHRTVRYVLAGGVSYVVEVSSFFGLYYALGVRSGIANALSMVIAWTVNYLLSSYFVFRGHTAQMRTSLPRHAIVTSTNLLVSSIIVDIAVDRLHIEGFIVKPLVSIAVAAWTYFAYKKFVFTSSKPASEPLRESPAPE